ncbi:hypothetical protein FF38_09910 [Lucilia cuprina]|uniref:Uncharacterized protein n=1 Tax=Lucilia cuprina TaxID=7375 RepID=A0A0L0BZR1_LUCCU|nr:hypothetical protein FF38_09910 [Lucilia cuprina]
MTGENKLHRNAMENTKKSHHLSTPPRPIFVIISCVCCLLQSCSAFIILLPIWYNRQCAITFLKMQFCVSTSSIMVIFLLGFLKMLPVSVKKKSLEIKKLFTSLFV